MRYHLQEKKNQGQKGRIEFQCVANNAKKQGNGTQESHKNMICLDAKFVLQINKQPIKESRKNALPFKKI
jgi:hypothetical protein